MRQRNIKATISSSFTRISRLRTASFNIAVLTTKKCTRCGFLVIELFIISALVRYQLMDLIKLDNVSNDQESSSALPVFSYNNNLREESGVFVDVWERILANYTKFHERYVESKDNTSNIPYIQWTCSERTPSNPYCGGIGDRIHGILQTFYMALCTDRIFLIDWETLPIYLTEHRILWGTHPGPDLSDLSVQYLDTINQPTSPYLIDPRIITDNTTGVTIRCNHWIEKNYSTCPIWNKYYNADYQSHLPRPDNNASIEVQYGHFMNTIWRRMAFQYLFNWSTRVMRTSLHIRQQANVSVPYVAAHIRTGGSDLSWQGDPYRHSSISDWQQFYNCSMLIQKDENREWLQRRHISDQYFTVPKGLMDIYVASDNPKAKEYIQQYDTSGHIRTITNLTIFHVDVGMMDNDKNDGEMIAWAELKLLIDAKCIVMSNSSYSSVVAIASNTSCAVSFSTCT